MDFEFIVRQILPFKVSMSNSKRQPFSRCKINKNNESIEKLLTLKLFVKTLNLVKPSEILIKHKIVIIIVLFVNFNNKSFRTDILLTVSLRLLTPSSTLVQNNCDYN